MGVKAVVSYGFAKGGEGTEELAQAVVEVVESGENNFKKLYDWNLSVEEKIETIATEIYGASEVDYSAKASVN